MMSQEEVEPVTDHRSSRTLRLSDRTIEQLRWIKQRHGTPHNIAVETLVDFLHGLDDPIATVALLSGQVELDEALVEHIVGAVRNYLRRA